MASRLEPNELCKVHSESAIFIEEINLAEQLNSWVLGASRTPKALIWVEGEVGARSSHKIRHQS